MFETRAETITDEVLKLCKSILGERFYGLYVGLESRSSFVLKHCINKQLRTESVLSAIKACKQNSIQIMVNVLVGATYLTTEESISNAVETVQWALSKGVDRCDLFPVHVKRFTPLAVLYYAGLYNPPSLWILVEVLNQLGASTWSSVGLSWYTSYGAYNIVASPMTCSTCQEALTLCLDGFEHTHKAEYVHKMNAIECSCKESLNTHHIAEPSLPERVIRGYNKMAEEVMGLNWWKVNKNSIVELVYSDWQESDVPFVV
jgi:radical SAM enzyme (TIGR01210 family)